MHGEHKLCFKPFKIMDLLKEQGQAFQGPALPPGPLPPPTPPQAPRGQASRGQAPGTSNQSAPPSPPVPAQAQALAQGQVHFTQALQAQASNPVPSPLLPSTQNLAQPTTQALSQPKPHSLPNATKLTSSTWANIGPALGSRTNHNQKNVNRHHTMPQSPARSTAQTSGQNSVPSAQLLALAAAPSNPHSTKQSTQSGCQHQQAVTSSLAAAQPGHHPHAPVVSSHFQSPTQGASQLGILFPRQTSSTPTGNSSPTSMTGQNTAHSASVVTPESLPNRSKPDSSPSSSNSVRLGQQTLPASTPPPTKPNLRKALRFFKR